MHPVLPETPQRQSTSRNKFVFDGWYLNNSIVKNDFSVMGDADYYAKYKAYSIIDNNGEVYPLDVVDKSIILDKEDILEASYDDITIYFNGVKVVISKTSYDQLKLLDSDIEVVLEKNIIGNVEDYNISYAQIVDIKLLSESGVISEFSPITISVAYGIDNINNLQVWEDVNGELIKVSGSRIVNGYLEFDLTKSSKYVVGVEQKKNLEINLLPGVILGGCVAVISFTIIIIVNIRKRREYL